jgi:hypothetical protein
MHCAIAGALMNAIGSMAPHVDLLTAPAAHSACAIIDPTTDYGLWRDYSGRRVARQPVVCSGGTDHIIRGVLARQDSAPTINRRVKPRCKGEISLVRYRDFYDRNFL